jgi:lipoyl-dependent peroxiredoxin
MPTRHASAVWEGGLQKGKGTFSGESGAVSAPFSFGSRFESAKGSNPEELLAAAEAACFSMALTAGLEQAGTPPTRVEARASATIEKQGAGFTITGIKLIVRATVPGIDAAKFKAAAESAKENCPVSKALKAVPIELDAQLT